MLAYPHCRPLSISSALRCLGFTAFVPTPMLSASHLYFCSAVCPQTALISPSSSFWDARSPCSLLGTPILPLNPQPVFSHSQFPLVLLTAYLKVGCAGREAPLGGRYHVFYSESFVSASHVTQGWPSVSLTRQVNGCIMHGYMGEWMDRWCIAYRSGEWTMDAHIDEWIATLILLDRVGLC